MGQHEKHTGQIAYDRELFEPNVTYVPFPHSSLPLDRPLPVWRVRFELASDPSICFGLDINDEVIFGRGKDRPNIFDLKSYKAEELGVSRRHFALRPTVSNLYIVDLGSTNGTFRNGQSIGVNNPHSLMDRDTITVGKLDFVVRILTRPRGHTAALQVKADLADILTETAKSITSQLDLPAILAQVAEASRTLTAAGETGIWLLDRETGELHLEAQWGIEDEEIQQIRIKVTERTPVTQVLNTGQILRMQRKPAQESIKVKTGYLVESILLVPLTLGGLTFGVIAAAHREPGKSFTQDDERVLTAIADFAAIAVQNARQYKAADEALANRVKELAAINQLSFAVTATLNLGTVYKVLMQEIHKSWKIDAASLWLYNEATDSIIVFGEDARHPAIESEKKLVREVIKSGIGQISDGLNVEEYEGETDDKESTARMRAQALACVPLHIEGHVVGALTLFTARVNAFKESDLKQLQSFANPVASAIANARLFAELEHKQATVQATADILKQPLMILDEDGNLIIANDAANEVLATHMAQVFEGISDGVGRTGELLIGDVTYVVTSEHSPGVGTIIVMQDISYVKKLERARTEFVQAVSHDLKSPLSSIKGYTYLLPQVTEMNQKGQEFLGRIDTAASNVLAMLSQLLDIALLSDSPQTQPVPCNLTENVRKAIATVEGAALARKMTITFEMDGEPYWIKGEPLRLYRSILNLLDNAVKYSTDNTDILVTLIYTKDEVVISVRDDGPGIPHQDLPNLFEQYFRGKQELGEQEGIGLGLSLVQSTARAHRGTVSARNVEGHGAEFTMTLSGQLRTDPAPSEKIDHAE